MTSAVESAAALPDSSAALSAGAADGPGHVSLRAPVWAGELIGAAVSLDSLARIEPTYFPWF